MNKRYQESQSLFERARHVMPGGVNSPVRAFRSVGGIPPFVERAEGALLIDADGNEYLDFVGSWGPMIAGHAHPHVLEAVRKAIERGFSYGAPTRQETILVEAIRDRVPGVDMVRLVNSGTEATMSALRLARAATRRDYVIKFDGCYHGHADPFLVSAGSGALDIGVPDSPGVPATTAGLTLVAPYNDLAAVNALLTAHEGQVAAVIVEPVCGNAGCIPPDEGFLEGLRTHCDKHDTLLIFDEVMTGFRVARGGAVERYAVQPDLVTFGKVIGGGFPIGAYAGPRHLMEQIAPSGPVYQAGTLSGNPVATAAGLATLELLTSEAYDRLETLGRQLEAGVSDILDRVNQDEPRYCFQRVGSMFTLFFTPAPVRSLAQASQVDTAAFRSFFHGVLADGIYMAPSPFESGFLSLAHSEDDVARLMDKIEYHLK
jgi:glutamate-1-semialdehyde 2,1-aminomutase